MSNRNLKYHQLMSLVSDSNPFKRTLVPRAFDVGYDIERDVESIFGRDEQGNELRRDLSPQGKREEALKASRRALRDLFDIRKQVDEYHAKTETMRAAAKLPAFDKTDIAGALNRRELRDRSFAMTPGQRAGLMTGKTRSVAFLDAILEFADDPWMAGINIHDPGEREIFEAAKQERLRDLHAPLLDSIAARETVESEALMVANVVRGDIAVDSGLESREFEAEAKRVENGVERIYVLVPDGGGFKGEIATPDQVRDGHFFASYEEYLASRAA